MTLLIVSFFPLVTRVLNKDKIRKLFKEVISPENITKISDKGPDEVATDFLEWVKEFGIYREGVYLKTLAPGIRGVYASRDFEPGETMVMVPLNSMIYEDFITDNPIIKKAQKVLYGPTLLAIIMYQEQMNPNFRFRPYFEIFPKYLGNLVWYFTAEDLKYIQGTNQRQQIQTYIDNAKSVYYDVLKLMPELKSMTHPEFIKVFAYVVSRSLRIPINGRRQLAMVPMFDMVNSYPPNRPDLDSVDVSFKPSPGNQRLVIVIKKKIKAEEEIFELYQGDSTNTEYLLNYGFVFPDVHAVTINIVLAEYQKDDPNLEKKKELMRFISRVSTDKIWPIVTVRNSTREEDYWPVYSVARILELKSAKVINALINEFKEKKRETIGRISKENEQRAMNGLLNVIEEVLEKYPSSAEEDERLMKELPMYSTPRNLVQLRYDERLGLLHIKNYCLKSLAEVANTK